MDYLDTIMKLIDKYGAPMSFCIYLAALQWRFNAQQARMTNRIAVKLGVFEEEDK